ncbi:DoxX family membrane protein [Streptomyces tropicalis]|uniref:DoxX family membrane protein n=1 Tax=Streptomyces tropicalis TaxID=3034234 RepID=A0ABT6A6W2_9ACTN|nr:DoxX family membrane protein [Streptomyces tropicalis]MDF3300389.1 DoxX family membrane protein [Streptomyces tropicalis]
MSVDTRTPRTPTGDRSSGIDDAPALSMVKVPSDPAQIIVNHASFRVQLGVATRRIQSPRIARHTSATQDPGRVPVTGTVPRPGSAGHRRPVVWSGRSAPDDTGAHRLLQAVRSGSVRHDEDRTAEGGATRVFPRVGPGAGYGHGGLGHDGLGHDGYDDLEQTVETPVVGPRRAGEPQVTRLLPHMRTVGSAYDEPGYGAPYGDPAYGDPVYDTPGHGRPAYPGDGYADDGYAGYDPHGAAEADRRAGRQGEDPVRHAYFPGRRMNLGVVLLPLRIFLGFISIYAGMGKICDPLYFDGGKRGSMVKWLDTLHPWEAAEPLRQFALHHPVGSGLCIAFLQVVVGVLTVLGCWQRVAAAVGALLSAALIVTVSWKTVPVYDAPDIIYLAAWSPLLIAGAPVYSVDGRLAASAWRRLGPRSDIWELRQFVLRRGALLTVVVTGLTLLVGSLLGGAVREAGRVVVPGPGESPRNELPGSPLPQAPGQRHRKAPSVSTAPTHGRSSAGPSGGPAATPGAARESGTATGGTPSQTQGTGQVPPRRSAPVEQLPSTSAGPTSGGSATGGTGPGGGSDTGTGGGSSSGRPGLVGGLLG